MALLVIMILPYFFEVEMGIKKPSIGFALSLLSQTPSENHPRQRGGYAKTKEVDIAQGLGAGKFIKKPFVLEKIGIAVKEELEK